MGHPTGPELFSDLAEKHRPRALYHFQKLRIAYANLPLVDREAKWNLLINEIQLVLREPEVLIDFMKDHVEYVQQQVRDTSRNAIQGGGLHHDQPTPLLDTGGGFQPPAVGPSFGGGYTAGGGGGFHGSYTAGGGFHGSGFHRVMAAVILLFTQLLLTELKAAASSRQHSVLHSAAAAATHQVTDFMAADFMAAVILLFTQLLFTELKASQRVADFMAADFMALR